MNRNEGSRNTASGCVRRDLLHDLISPWRRRGRKLLQIGGSALVPPALVWEAGFDAVCLETELSVLNEARESSGQVVEYFLGQPDLLPFDDDSFDYAVLPDLPAIVPLAVPSGEAGGKAAKDALRAVIEEAVRVASHGIILMSGNPLFTANWRREGKMRGVWPWELWLTARKVVPQCHVTLRSACGLPLMFTRKKISAQTAGGALPFPGCNSHSLLSPLPLGAVYGLRLAWTPLAGTPVGALRVPCLSSYGKQAAVTSPGLSADSPDCTAAKSRSGKKGDE